MSGVEFEEESTGSFDRRALTQEQVVQPSNQPKEGGLIGLVIKMGLARSKNTANIVLIIIMTLFFGASVAVVLVALV